MPDETTPATTLDWYVQALGDDTAFAAESATVAQTMVDDFIGGASNPFGVPDEVVARAVLEVGADLYYRKASRNGVATIEGVEPQMFRLNRDPMAAAYPLLRRYLVMGL